MADTTGVSGSAHWYVIHTYAGYENKVASDLMTIVENRKLQDMIMDVKIPTETVTETVTVKKDGVEQQVEREVEHKLFPGYVLVKMVMTNQTWFIVRNTRGCTGFVGHDSKLVPDSKPVPLTDEEAAKWGVEMKSERFAFEVGEEVKVVRGSMSGHTGIVNSIDHEAKTANINLDMFGRKVEAEVDLSSVVPLN
ncbi:MAG: transcription termination/antitermination protein NusG [Clostridia bacterium]|nr:transcription termination/antitermination protein NusG [Clostridia bacterium]